MSSLLGRINYYHTLTATRNRAALSTLLALRLASQEFAALGNIKAALFEDIILDAMAENCSKLESTNTAGFGEYVKGVTFRASPRCFELGLTGYKYKLLIQWLHHPRPEERIICSGQNSTTGCTGNPEDHSCAYLPYTELQIREVTNLICIWLLEIRT